ncbi:MAG: hypothetical protein KGI71_06385 [Patescibacteria group bacterium]|nr:hypothetical protein [Patescibacteria group bacterium]
MTDRCCGRCRHFRAGDDRLGTCTWMPPRAAWAQYPDWVLYDDAERRAMERSGGTTCGQYEERNDHEGL